jgi:hypothetical protein
LCPRAFVIASHFYPSLIFADKAGPYPSGALYVTPIYGKTTVLISNIRI